MSSNSKKKGETSSVLKLFGTDGVRGNANQFPMTPSCVLRIGQALGLILRQKLPHKEKVLVLIGKDTRISGYMVEQALACGLNSMGVFVHLTGPLPTPGIGFLAQNMRADAGVIISASHNPYHDNGIKIFGADGFKIPDEMEREIESWVSDQNLESHVVESTLIGRTRRIDDAAGRYIVDAKKSFPMDLTLEGLRIVLDCANGATYKVAPAIFEELGAEVIVTGANPDGFNINHEVGALFPEKLAQDVLKYRADLGISLDGDGDRVIMVDEIGRVVNGDYILAICALALQRDGLLKGQKVVATHMSNIGLEILLKNNGIELIRVQVGDKHVVQKMREEGYVLGGEQSGHIIFLGHSTTGDGTVAALRVLAVMIREVKKLSELADVVHMSPQVLLNVRVDQRVPLEEIEGYNTFYLSLASRLGHDGRLFIRYSGTEPLLRILVEGKEKRLIAEIASEMADFLKKKLARVDGTKRS